MQFHYQQCNYGHCQSSFHPSCARSAGYYMNLKTSGGKLQHKAYCEKHSRVERAKVNSSFGTVWHMIIVLLFITSHLALMHLCRPRRKSMELKS